VQRQDVAKKQPAFGHIPAVNPGHPCRAEGLSRATQAIFLLSVKSSSFMELERTTVQFTKQVAVRIIAASTNRMLLEDDWYDACNASASVRYNNCLSRR
jgi:hypothetical protein